MTDAQLIQFVRGFRKGILDGRSSHLMCALVCLPLVTLLNMHGVRCRVVETDQGDYNHVWLLLNDGRALDPTLDQFNTKKEKWPEVYLGPRTKYHG